MKGVPKYAWLFLLPLAAGIGVLIYELLKNP